MIRLIAYKILHFFANKLPLHISFAIADFVTDCKWFFSRIDKVSVAKNLKALMPEERNLQPHVREVFRNFGRYLVEFCWMKQHVNQKFVESNCSCQGLEHLDHALKQNKGAILLTAHIGNWEMGAAVLGVIGYPLTVIALTHPHSKVNDFFNEQRNYKGNNVVPMRHAARSCIKALQDNQLVALIADRDFSGNGLMMSFLGRQVSIPKGAAIMALKTGAPIIPAFFLRRGIGKFNIVFHSPIEVSPLPDVKIIDEVLIKQVMSKYIVEIEKAILADPTQWLMFREY